VNRHLLPAQSNQGASPLPPLRERYEEPPHGLVARIVSGWVNETLTRKRAVFDSAWKQHFRAGNAHEAAAAQTLRSHTDGEIAHALDLQAEMHHQAAEHYESAHVEAERARPAEWPGLTVHMRRSMSHAIENDLGRRQVDARAAQVELLDQLVEQYPGQIADAPARRIQALHGLVQAYTRLGQDHGRRVEAVQAEHAYLQLHPNTPISGRSGPIAEDANDLPTEQEIQHEIAHGLGHAQGRLRQLTTGQ
jgi:hypothetical protein